MKAATKRPPAAPAAPVEVEDEAAIDTSEPITTITPRIAAIIALIAQANDGELAAIEAAAAAIVGRQAATDPPILPPAAAACMALIESRPAWRGTSIDDMARAIGDATGSAWSDDSIRSEIIPRLKAWGVENCPRLGYRLPRSARNLHITHDMHPDMARSPAA